MKESNLIELIKAQKEYIKHLKRYMNIQLVLTKDIEEEHRMWLKIEELSKGIYYE